MSEKLEFPIEFSTCPVCGSTRTIAQAVGDEEIEKGRMRKDAKVPFLPVQAPIIDPSKMISLQCPLLIGFFDVCADCGALYCRRVDRTVGRVEAMPKGKPTMGFGSG